MDGSVLTLAIAELLLLTVVTTGLLWWYRSPDYTPPWVSLVVLATWLLGFSGTLLLPLDIAQALSDEHKSPGMSATWNMVYWSTFVLAWLVLPVLYEAWYAGDLTWSARVLSALKVNLISYLAMAIMGAIFCIWLLLSSEMTFGALGTFGMVFGNTYGLLLVIALLGNGLVEVPRAVWRYRDGSKEIQFIQLRAVMVDTDCYDCQCELDDAVASVHSMSRKVRSLPDSGSLRKHMDRILDTCDAQGGLDGSSLPLTSADTVRGRYGGASPHHSRSRARSTDAGAEIVCDDPSPSSLAAVARRLKMAQEVVHASQQRWVSLVLEYERALKRTRRPASSSHSPSEPASSSSSPSEPASSDRAKRGGLVARLSNGLRRSWVKSGLAQPCLALVSAVCTGLSVICVWSELTMGSPVSLSPWGLLISSLASDDGTGAHTVSIQLIALIPYCYMSLCTFYSLFKLKLFGLLRLSGPHQSTPGPLIFNAIYLSRLQFPLGYN